MSTDQPDPNRSERPKASASDNQFLAKNIGVILTFVASIAAVVVTAGQVVMTNIKEKAALELQRNQHDQEFKVKIAQFVLENDKKIFSDNPQEQARIQSIMIVTFPPEVTNAIFAKLEETQEIRQDPRKQEILQQGRQSLLAAKNAERNSKYQVSYTSIAGVDSAKHQKIVNYLKEQGFQIERADQRQDQPSWFATQPTILYYDDSSRQKAQDIANDLQRLTAVNFQIARGAGRGVPSSKKQTYFIIHYMK